MFLKLNKIKQKKTCCGDIADAVISISNITTTDIIIVEVSGGYYVSQYCSYVGGRRQVKINSAGKNKFRMILVKTEKVN